MPTTPNKAGIFADQDKLDSPGIQRLSNVMAVDETFKKAPRAEVYG